VYEKECEIILIIILSILCILNGIYNIKLNNENIDLKEKNNKLTNKDKIETYEDDIKEIEYKKATIKVLEVIGNIGIRVEKNLKEGHSQSPWYRVDKYENGKWIKLDRKKEIPQMINEIYAWPTKEPHIYVRNWKDDYGYLPKGIYRYIEMACIEDKNENDYITCIFEIKE
jgi:hypothetical protein